MAVGNYSRPKSREYERKFPSEVLPYQLVEGLKLAVLQRVFFILDLDETTFTGCLQKHDRAYRLWANITGYDGVLPEFTDVAALGRARLAYEQILPNAACLEDRMRGAKVAHQLEPMHPLLETILSEMAQTKFRPSLSLTARPQHLEKFSRDELRSALNLDIPVYAMPKEIQLANSGEWKLRQLLRMKQELQRKKKLRPIVLFDDSREVSETINSCKDPDIFCIRYVSDPKPQLLEANWETIQTKLQEIEEFWENTRKQQSRLHR